MPWKMYNPNPAGRHVGDCTVRAISKAVGSDWEQIYIALALQGYLLNDMPSANHVWGAYLKSQGWRRHLIPDTCPDCYTVEDFCKDHPNGTYLLAISGHVVTVKDGCYWDTWDSGKEIPIYYWQKEDE